MHVNRTRIILIVMIVATVVLGVAAIFIGWRLQNQVNTNSFASCTCPEPQSNWEGPDQYNKCWSRIQSGHSELANCTGTTPPPPGNNDARTACESAGGCYNSDGAGSCISNGQSWCYTASQPCGGRNDWCKATCVNATVQKTFDTCQIGACPTTQCKDVTVGSTTFGQCIAGGSANCTVTAPANNCQRCDCGDTGTFDYGGGTECRRNCSGWNQSCASTNVPACGQLDFPGGSNLINKTGCTSTTPPPNTLTCYKCTDATTDGNACSTQTVTGSSCPSGWTTNSNCASQATGGSCSTTTTQNTCYKCTDAEDDGNTCQTQTTTGTCAALGTGWTTNSSCATAATGGSCTAAIQAKVSGRVYCQDPGGIIIPIPNSVIAITKGSTTVNATTDSDGFYVSSAIGLPSGGDKVAVDIGSLPSTFNNGLNTSQLTGKSALNCATTSKLAGCSTGVASNYYCDSVTTKNSYANCKITTVGDSTSGHGYFDFKYTNCSAAVPSCGNSVVDNGEACDPVGTVGQCTNGGKCQTGCACSTCNSACTTNDDCPDGLICSSNSCRNPSNTSALDCKVRVVPSTGILDGNYLLIFISFILMILGLITVRNQGAITLMTNVAISLFGTNILRYVDPAGSKRYYEKNILSKQNHEVK